MLKVGLTGGIGSGKTTVANLFAERRIPVIDTDVISHQLSQTQEVIDEITTAFGDDILDGERIDRAALAKRVFSDDALRSQLEGIMHPRIRKQVAEQFEQAKDAPYVIIVVPLLLETDYHLMVDRILIVDTDEELQLSRVQQRDGRDEAAVRAIMGTQLSRQERLARADDVIDNSGGIERLALRIDDLDQLYRELSQST